MIKETKQYKPKPKTFLENSFKKPSLSCSYYSTSKITNATSLNTHYDNPYIGEEVEFYKKKPFLSHSYRIRIFQGGWKQCLFLVVTLSTIRIFLQHSTVSSYF